MLDFTSALYLDMRHPLSSLRPWRQFTTGRPAALVALPGAVGIARRVARLQGCERATLAPSTLHVFWDLFGMLAKQRLTIHVEDGTYAIARWGVERAAALGVRAQTFPHQDIEALHRRLRQDAARGSRPVIVTDGFCLACGRPGPLAEYLAGVKPLAGYLVIDDTQALGILGASPGPEAPYGRGGGGSLRWSNIKDSQIIVVSSLAKGFGAPLAVLAGSAALVQQFEEESATRVHCSPPSIAAIHAAERALALNAAKGDWLRRRLAQRVEYFRGRLRQLGFSARGGLFPVQMLEPMPRSRAEGIYARLLRQGVRALLLRSRHGSGVCLSFIVTVHHTRKDIEDALAALARAADVAEFVAYANSTSAPGHSRRLAQR